MPLVIYTDESGVHNNRYLVICAIITATEQSRKRIKNLMRKKLVEFQSSDITDELHSYHLSVPQRQDIHVLLSKQHDYQVAYLVADKNHLQGALKKRPNLCYNYLFSILFKNLVIAFKGQDIRIIGDNRTVSAGSKNSLPEYIKTEAYAKWGYTNNLEIQFEDSRNVKGLQAADIVANAIYAEYNLGKSHLYNIQSTHYITKLRFPYKTFGT